MNVLYKLQSIQSVNYLFKWAGIFRRTKKRIEIRSGNWGFPGGAVVKNPPASAGDTGSSPGPGRSHMPRSN